MSSEILSADEPQKKISARLTTATVAAVLLLQLTYIGNALAQTASCSAAGNKSVCHINGEDWKAENSGANWSVAAENLPAKTGVRFEVHSGDTAPWDIAHNHIAERTEISGFKHKLPLDTNVWFAFDLMVDPGAPVSGKWNVLGQLKATEDPGDKPASPVWAQELDANDVFKIVTRSTTQKPVIKNPPHKDLFVDPQFQRGKIYHFVYCLRYSAQGLIRAWRDGVQIVDYQGPVGYLNQQGPYFKFGIYRQPAPETFAVHYYNIRIDDPALSATVH